MVLDLMHMEVFCCQMVVGLVIFSADMSPVPADNKKKISWFLVNTQQMI